MKFEVTATAQATDTKDGIYWFGIWLSKPTHQRPVRDKYFEIVYMAGGKEGIYRCFGTDEADARKTIKDEPGYFGCSIESVKEIPMAEAPSFLI